jgi:hypothetical protein
MKRITLMLFAVALGFVLIGKAIPQQGSGQTEIPTDKLVGVLRTLNTSEFMYRRETGRFADRDQILVFLKQKGLLNKLPVDVENPKPYELTITTTADGMHYQITFQRPSEMNNKATWCKTVAFSDDRGVIFLGQAIDCAAAPR